MYEYFVMPNLFRHLCMKVGYVYILGNNNLTIYIGVTSDLIKRIHEHKGDYIDGFTKKYKLHKLLYYEVLISIGDAINREKQLKNWHRNWKLNLIKKFNPEFKDLFPLII